MARGLTQALQLVTLEPGGHALQAAATLIQEFVIAGNVLLLFRLLLEPFSQQLHLLLHQRHSKSHRLNCRFSQLHEQLGGSVHQ